MSKRVLIIEDERHIIEALSYLLEKEMWEVRAYSNGENALIVINQFSPDVVILDIMLPNKSGLEILDEIRSKPSLQNLPVLMLTAKGQHKDREAAYKGGVSAFMTKPFSNKEIVEKVKALLA